MNVPLCRRAAGAAITLLFLPLHLVFLAGCSFDYGGQADTETGPDIVMRDMEYVRMRDGAPQVRFRAQGAERWEKKQTMELKEFSFEQFQGDDDEVNSSGSAGAAQVRLDSGDISMTDGVRLEVESEDFTIETAALSWRDNEHQLQGSDDGVVDIQRSDGTFFRGRGFSADTRKRSWVFSGSVEGAYVYEEEEGENAE